ncbi:hypothetical protein COCVIDRAFT_84959, partial [Bipolaris victoriae FI3]
IHTEKTPPFTTTTTSSSSSSSSSHLIPLHSKPSDIQQKKRGGGGWARNVNARTAPHLIKLKHSRPSFFFHINIIF